MSVLDLNNRSRIGSVSGVVGISGAAFGSSRSSSGSSSRILLPCPWSLLRHGWRNSHSSCATPRRMTPGDDYVVGGLHLVHLNGSVRHLPGDACLLRAEFE